MDAALTPGRKPKSPHGAIVNLIFKLLDFRPKSSSLYRVVPLRYAWTYRAYARGQRGAGKRRDRAYLYRVTAAWRGRPQRPRTSTKQWPGSSRKASISIWTSTRTPTATSTSPVRSTTSRRRSRWPPKSWRARAAASPRRRRPRRRRRSRPTRKASCGPVPRTSRAEPRAVRRKRSRRPASCVPSSRNRPSPRPAASRPPMTIASATTAPSCSASTAACPARSTGSSPACRWCGRPAGWCWHIFYMRRRSGRSARSPSLLPRPTHSASRPASSSPSSSSGDSRSW